VLAHDQAQNVVTVDYLKIMNARNKQLRSQRAMLVRELEIYFNTNGKGNCCTRFFGIFQQTKKK
jgi:hypothetical protein